MLGALLFTNAPRCRTAGIWQREVVLTTTHCVSVHVKLRFNVRHHALLRAIMMSYTLQIDARRRRDNSISPRQGSNHKL